MKKEIIVFSGFNQRAILAFLRTLKKYKVPFSIIASSIKDTILLSDYKAKVIAIRKKKQLNLIDLISSIKKVKNEKEAEEYIIAPSTEALNRFLLKNRAQFKKINCAIPLINKNLYEKISDKYSFGEICEQYGILVPKTISPNKNSKFPFVAKPRTYFSSKKTDISLNPVIIENKQQWNGFKKQYLIDDFYFQKFIEGKSLYLLYYFHRNGKVYKFSQENYIQQYGGKSVVAAKSSTFHLDKESSKYEKMFKKLKFHGLIMIEVRQRGQMNYMIEANPRFWGPSQLFIDAQANLFLPFLHDYELITSLPAFNPKKGATSYCWFGGMVETISEGNQLFFHKSNKADLIDELSAWLHEDIYMRQDSEKIFLKELTSE